MAQARIVAFEGIDASGKHTQAQQLKRYLKRKGFAFAEFAFPRHGAMVFGRIIDEYLAGKYGDPTTVSPYLASILYAADRSEVTPAIKDAVRTKDFVIIDRYTGSNQAHQLVKIKNRASWPGFLSWLDSLEHEYFKVPRADTIIYLRVPFAATREMIKEKVAREKRKMDGHERDTSYLKNVAAAYDAIAKKNQRWHIIECGKEGKILSPAEIAVLVRGALGI